MFVEYLFVMSTKLEMRVKYKHCRSLYFQEAYGLAGNSNHRTSTGWWGERCRGQKLGKAEQGQIAGGGKVVRAASWSECQLNRHRKDEKEFDR